MATNTHPRGGRGVFQIELRPNQFNPTTFDEVIERQGQFARFMKSRPCPVRTELSHHDLHCRVCHGRGEIYEFQQKYWIYNETSPHGSKNPLACEAGLIKPWWRPIIEVGNVVLFRSEDEGGVIEYEIVSFDEDEIRITNDCLPESFQVLLVDYAINLFEEKEQIFTGDGESFVFEMNLPMNINRVHGNNQKFHKSIAEIISVKYNDTNEDIPVKTFYDQSIYFDSKPENGREFTIKVNAAEPATIAIEPLSIKLANELKWDMETGDMLGWMAESWEIGKGDLLTCLGVRNRQEEIITRSDLPYDVLPYFDIFSISGNIIDEEGKKYINEIDFKLFDYNKVLWIPEKNSPSKGINYSIVLFERTTYRVKNEKAELNASENKRLPKRIHLKKLERFISAPIIPGLKNNDELVGDWVKDYGGVT